MQEAWKLVFYLKFRLQSFLNANQIWPREHNWSWDCPFSVPPHEVLRIPLPWKSPQAAEQQGKASLFAFLFFLSACFPICTSRLASWRTLRLIIFLLLKVQVACFSLAGLFTALCFAFLAVLEVLLTLQFLSDLI